MFCSMTTKEILFKVIVNRRNNVPFHFEEFWNDHVQFVILLKTKTNHQIFFHISMNCTSCVFLFTNLQVYLLHAVVVVLVWQNIPHEFQPRHAEHSNTNHAGRNKQKQKNHISLTTCNYVYYFLQIISFGKNKIGSSLGLISFFFVPRKYCLEEFETYIF